MQQDGDLKFYYQDLAPADIRVSGSDLYRDPGFETAVLVSLFSDRRADPEDPLPDHEDTRRGFWGDALAGSPLGSKLWLLGRAKLTDATFRQAEQYVAESLAWMKDDGIADRIEVSARRGGRNEVIFSCKVVRLDNSNVLFRWYLNWEKQIFGGLDAI